MSDKQRAGRLVRFAYEPDELARGRAFVELGETAARIAAQGELEDLREIIRRLLWSMNDESGGVGWFAAEAAAAIMIGAPALIDEYGIILASIIRMSPFEPSVHRALARLVPVKPQLFRETAGELEQSIKSGDALERATAAVCLAAIDAEKYRRRLLEITDDDSVVAIFDYETGEVVEKTVAEAVKSVLQR